VFSATPKAKPSQPAQKAEPDAVQHVNAEFFATLTEDLAIINDHPVFRDLVSQMPLGALSDDMAAAPALKKSRTSGKQKIPMPLLGTQSAFSIDEYRFTMSHKGKYKCACNEWWLEPFFVMQTGIPYITSNITNMVETTFNNADTYDGTTIVRIPDKNYNPLEHKGKLQRLSPEEPFFAKIKKIRLLIDNGATEDELLPWKASILGASFQFELHTDFNETALPRHLNMRETSKDEAIAVGRDNVQRVYEVQKVRVNLGGAEKKAISNEKLSEYYDNKIVLSKSSEKVSKSFLEIANLLWATIFVKWDNICILRMCSEEWSAVNGGPLNSVYKLQVVVSKSDRDPRMITWVLASVFDNCRDGKTVPGEISLRGLKDGIGGNKGLVDVYMFKTLRTF